MDLGGVLEAPRLDSLLKVLFHRQDAKSAKKNFTTEDAASTEEEPLTWSFGSSPVVLDRF
jgi:hypothetical protein